RRPSAPRAPVQLQLQAPLAKISRFHRRALWLQRGRGAGVRADGLALATTTRCRAAARRLGVLGGVGHQQLFLLRRASLGPARDDLGVLPSARKQRGTNRRLPDELEG